MLNKRLKQLRQNKNLLQKDVAAALKISTSSYGFYEQGARTPDNDMLNRMADFFNVSTDYLLGRTDIQNTPEIVAFHKNTPGDFTEEEKDEIDNFIQYIISKRDKE